MSADNAPSAARTARAAELADLTKLWDLTTEHSDLGAAVRRALSRVLREMDDAGEQYVVAEEQFEEALSVAHVAFQVAATDTLDLRLRLRLALRAAAQTWTCGSTTSHARVVSMNTDTNNHGLCAADPDQFHTDTKDTDMPRNAIVHHIRENDYVTARLRIGGEDREVSGYAYVTPRYGAAPSPGEQPGMPSLSVAGHLVRHPDGLVGGMVVSIITPVPPTPVDPPDMRRSPDGQNYAVCEDFGDALPWRVAFGPFYSRWFTADEVADWVPMTITDEEGAF